MNEVSCQVLDVFFQHLKREGRSAAPLACGLPFSLPYLQRRQNRIDWEHFVRFMHNAGLLWDEEGLARVGESFFLSRGMRAMSMVARLLFDGPGFYRWVFEKQTGAGDQSFSGVFENGLEELGPLRLRLRLRIRPGFPSCPQFFAVALGNFRGMPRALGLPPAEVQMRRLPDGASYDVEVPPGAGALVRLKRAALLPFTAQAVAAELKESLVSLQERFSELSAAREALADQTDRLKIVNRLGRELAQHTRLDGLAEAMARVFSEELPHVGLSVWVTEDEGAQQRVLCESGRRDGRPLAHHILVSGEEKVGRLEVFAAPESSSLQLALLDDLVPWISIAVGNARSFTLLEEYRDQLSSKVEGRTAQLNHAMLELEGSLSREREAIRLKTEFFDNVSHELRTPLTLILLTLESLHAQELSAPAHQHLDRLQRSASRLLRLINDLLQLAKLESGKLRLRYEPVDLNQLLEAVLIPFRVLAEHTGLQLRLEASPTEAVHGDPERLDVVFQNLLSNALKFTEKGEVVVRIRQDAFFVRVEVVDTGVGIHPEDLTKLFERFAQADVAGTRRFGGTGIGLALTRETVELHGGTVEVHSAPGRGSTFAVSLPRGTAHVKDELRPARAAVEEPSRPKRVPALTPLPGPPPSQAAAPTQPPPGASTLLVVEDDPEMRAVLVELLRPHYQVLQAPDGAAGLELARASRPALIISDVMMPLMSGLTLLAHLRQSAETAEIPVLFLTARHEVEARVEGLQVGASDYLSKPFSPRELLARVETQLRLRQATARIAQTEQLAATSLITSGFAHEVRNPLNGLINALAPLREAVGERPDPQLATAMLDVVEESVGRIRHLADSLLSMVRHEPVPTPVDVGASLRAAQRSLEWKLPREVKVEQDHHSALPVLGKAGPLTQLWINLLDNALRAVGGAGTVRLTTATEGEEVVVRVVDDGCGMSAEAQARAFEPFFSTRASGEGTGLGLALCRRIVQQHQGRIELESILGEGTTVTIRLPAWREDQPLRV